MKLMSEVEVKFGSGFCRLIIFCAVGSSRSDGMRLFGKGWRINPGLRAEAGSKLLNSGLTTVVVGSKICPVLTHCPEGVPSGFSKGTSTLPDLTQPPPAGQRSRQSALAPSARVLCRD